MKFGPKTYFQKSSSCSSHSSLRDTNGPKSSPMKAAYFHFNLTVGRGPPNTPRTRATARLARHDHSWWSFRCYGGARPLWEPRFLGDFPKKWRASPLLFGYPPCARRVLIRAFLRCLSRTSVALQAVASALRAGALPVLLTTQRPEAGQNGRELLLVQKRRSGSEEVKTELGR